MEKMIDASPFWRGKTLPSASYIDIEMDRGI